MVITSFAELRRAVLQDVMLDTSFFAERVQVTPAHGSQREISAQVRHEYEQDDDVEERRRTGTIDEVETVYVLVSTDEADATTGGIRDPQPGLLLWRTEEKDPDRRPFQYSGEIIGRYEHKLRLKFQRMKRTAQGTGIA